MRKLPIMLVAESQMKEQVIPMIIAAVPIYTGISPRTEYEKKAKFNQDDYKPTPDEISRFPNRPKNEQPESDHRMDLIPHASKDKAPRMRPPGYRK